MNNTELFNTSFTFAVVDNVDEHQIPTEFKEVNIPHDYLIYDTNNLYKVSTAYYKKTFNCEKNTNYELYFEGIYMNSYIYINGIEVATWKYGYTSFTVNITDYIVEGSNEILVKVVYKGDSSRWYSGGGIYRNVYLKTYSDSTITTNGVYVHTQKTNDTYKIEIDTDIITNKELILENHIYGNGIDIYTTENAKQNGTYTTYMEDKFIEWDFNNPILYTLSTKIYNTNNELIEEVKQKIGFKNIRFDSEKGFFLNGKHYKLNGTCEHHDLGALGSATNKSAIEYRLDILKNMGVNSIRTSHNPPSKEFMNLADEKGFLIINEAFDMWEKPKNKNDYGIYFKEWYKKDVEAWIKRDRNHVSLLMWSIGNEINDTHTSERGQEITKNLIEEVKKYDYKQNAPITIGSNYMAWENARKCTDIVKYAGYNYGEYLYDEQHANHKDWFIYGSETSSVVQSRGIYHFPLSQSILADEDEQCSSLGNSSTSWGAKNPEYCILMDAEREYSLGQYIWTGFDYIGEPTPYKTKNSYFGQIDTACFPKDPYYVYKSIWAKDSEAFIHIFPYWDFNEGQTIDLRVATNLYKVELYLNNNLIGVTTKDDELIHTFQVPYTKGTIEAKAYDKDGKFILSKTKQSFDNPYKITMSANKNTICSNGLDLVFVEINVIDKNNNIVENANNKIDLTIENGEIIGLDNGDSTDYEQYKSTSRRLFNGKLMAIIRTTSIDKVKITANSVGLIKDYITLSINKKEAEIFVKEYYNENIKSDMDEIYPRKINLINNSNNVFDGLETKTITYSILPANINPNDLSFSIISNKGVISNLATMEINNNIINLTPNGNGDFRLRATWKNKQGQVKLMSELDFKIINCGTLYKNPYDFIYGASYDYENGNVTNGNEKGFATARDKETIVGFHNIDFGTGSNKIHLPIFSLDDDEYNFQIYNNHPYEDGELLGDYIYCKPSIWNTYQPEDYVLNKKINGISNIYFKFNKKVHLKGFSFAKENDTYKKILAVNSDFIYGDLFDKENQMVANIGNNVSLEFENVDFEDSVSNIEICGYTPNDVNTIIMNFITEGEIVKNSFEFIGNTESTISFNIDNLDYKGKGKLVFLFLPGSNFNFKSFKFNK